MVVVVVVAVVAVVDVVAIVAMDVDWVRREMLSLSTSSTVDEAS